MTYLTSFLSLCQSHPAATFMVLGAVVSCFYKYLDKYPRLHAFFEILAHAGVNVPGIVNAVGRLLTGVASSAAAGVVGLVLSISVAATAGAFMLFVTVSGCTPAQDASAVTKAEQVAGDAYMLSGQACVDLADSGVDNAAAKACAKALLVVGADLAKAENDLGDVCKLAPVVAGLSKVPFPGGTPGAVKALLSALNTATAFCAPSSDAGAE